MIDYINEDLFHESSIDKQYVLTDVDDETFYLTNENLYSESIRLEETISSSLELQFGECNASKLTFTIANEKTIPSLIGKTFKVEIFLGGDYDNPFVLGYYKVDSDVPTANRYRRDITCYDSLYDVVNIECSDWYNDLTFPTTLGQFRNSFCEYVGLDQETISLVNDAMSVEETIAPSQLSGSDVLRNICELNGVFAHIGRDGKLHYVSLARVSDALIPSNDLYPSDELFPRDTSADARIPKSKYISCQYEDYTVTAIDGVQIRQEEGDIGGSYGAGDNAYIVEDNFLCYGKTSENLSIIAENLYSNIGGRVFRPCSIESVGNPCIEVGDSIRAYTDDVVIITYVLSRVLTGCQSLTDVYTADGSEYRTEELNSTRNAIVQLRGKTNKLETDVEQTRLTITDVQSGLQTQITANAQGLTTKVSAGEIVSTINQSAEAVTISADKIDLNGLVTADEFTTKFATISNLNSVSATVNTINANYISASTVRSTYATIESLNATNLTVSGKLDASEFTAKNINAMEIKVKAANVTGTLKASQISTDLLRTADLSSSIANLSQVNAKAIIVDNGFTYQSHAITTHSFKDVSGNTYTCLCY